MLDRLRPTEDPFDRLRGNDQPDSRILVVEDDADLMNIVIRMADRLDSALRVDRAADVQHALEKIERHSYRVVLADYFLRGSKCGLSLREPCANQQPSAIFAMMSSLSVQQMWNLSAQAPFPYLRKPFSAEELFGFLRATLA
ncbi:MAG: response regulator [bacterium]|nr:response regulator [bacterium]